MKNFIFLFGLLITLISCDADRFFAPSTSHEEKLIIRSSNTYEAYNSEEEKSYRVTLTVSNDTAYVDKTVINYSTSHSHGMMVNLSGIDLQGDSLLILNPTQSYLFIPFSDAIPFFLFRLCVEFRCGCGNWGTSGTGCVAEEEGQDGEYVRCYKEGQSCQSQYCIGFIITYVCSPTPTPSSEEFPAGGIIVPAKELIMP